MKCTVSIFIALFLSSCATSRLPIALTQNQVSSISGVKYKCTVAVEKNEFSIYSDRLLVELTKSELFDSVVPSVESDNPEFIARITEHVYGSPTIPVIAIVTLGMIPSTCTERQGFKFDLIRKSDNSSRSIDAVYSGTTWLGWIALPMMILPAYSAGDPVDSSRYINFFKYSIISSANDILKDYTKP